MVVLEIIFDIFARWGALFVAPFRELDMLWIIIPIYLTWIFADIYQEKKGTSFGNAISNGVIMLWVGIDWLRKTVNLWAAGSIAGFSIIGTKVILAIIVLIYGIFVLIEGVRGKSFVKYIGRVREISYIAIMLSPIFYQVVPLDWLTVAAILVGFPIFYGVAELLMKVTPSPQTYEGVEGGGMGDSSGGDMGEMGPMTGFGGHEQADNEMPDMKF